MYKNTMILLGGAGVFFVGLAQAAAMPMASNTLLPFYAGASVGLVTGANAVNDTVTALQFPDSEGVDRQTFSNRSFKADLGQRGALHVGVRALFNSFYLGGEVFGGYANASQKGKSSYVVYDSDPIVAEKGHVTNKTTAKLSGFEYGADVIPGWMLTPKTLLFADLGLVRSKIKLTSKSDYNDWSNDPFIGPVNDSATVKARHGQYKTGVRFGLGVERFFTDHFSMRLSDIFTCYGKIKAKAEGVVHGRDSDNSGVLETNSSVRLRTQTVSLDFNYAL